MANLANSLRTDCPGHSIPSSAQFSIHYYYLLCATARKKNMTACTAETRQRMLNYWQGHGKPSVEMMMLDNNAASIAEQETLEILSMLPDFNGADVIELGAGIGRFTQHLAPAAGSLHSSDFMPAFIDKNREVNGHHGNLHLEVADATQMTRPVASADLVFSNWLFMYLDDAEVRGVFAKILGWLRPGGHFFFRESCFHRSGSVARTDNPTKYRTPQRYNELLLEAASPGDRFALVFARPSRTYVSVKQNRNQVCWLVRKAPLAAPEELQQLRDSQGLLSEASVAKLEAAFGPGFLSAAAAAASTDRADDLCEQLDVKPGETVLDVGCGLGETSCLLATKYGANVIGVDISGPLVSLALQRANQQGVPNVIFEVADIETYELYQEASFDVIFSRDVTQYVGDREKVLAKFYKWLKPGGRLLLTDYCAANGDRSLELPGDLMDSLCCATCRSEHRRQPLSSPAAYLETLHRVGFVELTTDDRTPRFEAAAKARCQMLSQGRPLFEQQFGQARFEQAQENWQRRLAMCLKGELAWTMFHLIKRDD